MIIDKILARGEFEEGNKQNASYMRYTYNFDAKIASIIINLQTASADKFIGNSNEVSHNQKEIREYMCKKLLNELKTFLSNKKNSDPLVIIDAEFEKLTIKSEAFRFIEEYEENNDDNDLVDLGLDELPEAMVIINNFYALYFSSNDSAILFREIFYDDWNSYVCYLKKELKSFIMSTSLPKICNDNPSDNLQRIIISSYLANQLRIAYQFRIILIVNKNPADFITDQYDENGLGLYFTLRDNDLRKLIDCVNKHLEVNQLHRNSDIYELALYRLLPYEESSITNSISSSSESEAADENDGEDQSEVFSVDHDSENLFPCWATVSSGAAAVVRVERISGEENPQSDGLTVSSLPTMVRQNKIITGIEESDKSDAENQLRPPRKESRASSCNGSEESLEPAKTDKGIQDNKIFEAAANSVADISPTKSTNNNESLSSSILDNRYINAVAQNVANPRIYKDKSKVVLNQLQNRVYGRIDREVPYDQKQNYFSEIKVIIAPINDVEILSDIYHFINYESNKKILNVHKNTIRDMVFLKIIPTLGRN